MRSSKVTMEIDCANIAALTIFYAISKMDSRAVSRVDG
jgi:hypothetical protein